MQGKVISSITLFSSTYPNLKVAEGTDSRSVALKKYFSDGGVVSVEASGPAWPKLVYPSVSRLESQITTAATTKQNFEKEKARWEKKLLEENLYHFRHNVYKFSQPVYWKHVAKLLTNRDYKHDAGQVSLPAHLVSDKRWKPMVETFVNNIEYRKQLVETVQQGLVYKNSKKVGKYANDLREFRMEIATKKITALKEKIKQLDEQIKAFQEIRTWAKEKK